MCERHLRSQLSDWLEPALDARHARARHGRQLAILALDERRDLLQKHDERRREREQIVFADRWLRARRDHRAIERRERVVVPPIGLASLARVPLVDGRPVCGRHAKILRFMSQRAIITGITGQDGSYLTELLLEKGYDVFGLVRRSSTPNLWRIQHLLDRITLKPADLLDQLSLIR